MKSISMLFPPGYFKSQASIVKPRHVLCMISAEGAPCLYALFHWHEGSALPTSWPLL